jgi:hypothetical protein
MKNPMLALVLVAAHLYGMNNTPEEQYNPRLPTQVGFCAAGLGGIGSIPLLIAVPMHGAVTAIVATGIIFGSFAMGYSVTALCKVACAAKEEREEEEEEIPLTGLVTK